MYILVRKSNKSLDKEVKPFKKARRIRRNINNEYVGPFLRLTASFFEFKLIFHDL